MPFDLDPAVHCPSCPYNVCIEDRRENRVPGRTTRFRLKQLSALQCTFADFIPGFDGDPDPARPLSDYLTRFRLNAEAAGRHLFGTEFKLEPNAFSKVEGDVFELMEAAALWNAAAVWNQFQETGQWVSRVLRQPEGAVPTPARRVAIVKLPRGYDATRLFVQPVRDIIRAHEHALFQRDMELGHSSPDIVGVRLPQEILPVHRDFHEPIHQFNADGLHQLETAHATLEGAIAGNGFLFAIAVKRSTRSDRLYQPLFEANVLKYLVHRVGGGASLRFHVHMESFAGADVVGRYRAASLVSLLGGGEPARAIDRVEQITNPLSAAQMILDELPRFPL